MKTSKGLPPRGPKRSAGSLCTNLCFILYGNNTSRDFHSLSTLHFSHALLTPQGIQRGKPRLPFNQAQPTPNGSFRQMLISGKRPCTYYNDISWEIRFEIFLSSYFLDPVTILPAPCVLWSSEVRWRCPLSSYAVSINPNSLF